MKVGILTFSAAHNFGAVLQCFGLFKTIQQLGFDVKVIDYRPDYLATYKPVFGWRQFLNRHLVSLPSRYTNFRYWRRIYDGYMDFKSDNLKMTHAIYNETDLKEISSKFDFIIIGSDQIWNSSFNGGDQFWYGSPSGKTKWITYAASAGNLAKWLDTDNLKVKLENFSSISARETELARAIDQVLGKSETPTVLDPSLLAFPRIWDNWKKPVVKEDYILVYQARESDDVFRIAEELKLQLNCQRIIPIDFYGNVNQLGYTTFTATPEEFISLIANARCMVTTSFHGTAFSIILKTPFYTVRLNDGADGRSEDLLNNLGLRDRMIDKNITPIFELPDFTRPLIRLEELRNSSLEYLKNALS